MIQNMTTDNCLELSSTAVSESHVDVEHRIQRAGVTQVRSDQIGIRSPVPSGSSQVQRRPIPTWQVVSA